MLCYAITERARYGGDEPERCAAVLENVRQWAAQGMAFIQMREKDLAAAEQEKLAQAMQKILDSTGSRLLVNSRADVALSAGAAGVHLTSVPGGLTPGQVRAIYARAGRPAPVVSVSCHTLQEVERAREQQASLILFAPVFGKTIAGRVITPSAGLEALRAAYAAAGTVPVLALGGVTAENSGDCLAAGAAGIAGITLFSGKD